MRPACCRCCAGWSSRAEPPALAACCRGLWCQDLAASLLALDLSGCVLLPAAALPQLLAGCSCLQALSLAKQPGLQDREVAAVLASCPGLTALDVSGCTQLTRGAVDAAAQLLPGLQELRARGLWRLQDAGLLQLAGCSGLRWVRCRGCVGTGAAISMHPNRRRVTSVADPSSPPALRRCLDLGGCWQLSSAALAAVLRAATRLTELHLPGCPALDDLLLPDFHSLLDHSLLEAADARWQQQQPQQPQQQQQLLLQMLRWERVDLSGTSVTGAALLYLGVRAPRLAHLSVDK